MSTDTTDAASLRYRLGRPRDVPEILRHLRRSPPLYGPASLGSDAFASTLTVLLEERAILANLLVEQRGELASLEEREPETSPHVLALGLTGFVAPAVADAWLRRPPDAVTDHLIELERSGEPVLLRRPAVARQNANEGLDLLFIAYSPPVGDAADPGVSKLIALTHDAFRMFHAGYHCRRILHPAPPDERGMGTLLSMGFRKLDTGSGLLTFDLSVLMQLPFHPFIILRRGTPPRLGFPPAEQETLLHALLGRTDQELAEELQVSAETIRKRWRSVFQRIARHPDVRMFPTESLVPVDGSRGAGKRRAVLEYVRTHLEELRPYAP